MRVLVTGATGFVGSHLVQELLAANHEVAAILRPGTSRNRARLIDSAVRRVEAPLADAAALRRGLGDWQPGACIHLAWFGEPETYLGAPENLECLSASLGLLEALAGAGCSHVVMAGTCAEYDTDAGFLREDSPTRPRTLYAASKLAAGVLAAARAEQLGIGLTWARLFYLYGPHEDPRRLVPAIITTLLRGERFAASEGSQVRDYLHVTDVASALRALAEAGVSGPVNVCSGRPVVLRDLMNSIGALLGGESLIAYGERKPRDWDPTFVVGDNRRLRTQTAWSARVSLEEGLEATIRWWKRQSQGERAA